VSSLNLVHEQDMQTVFASRLIINALTLYSKSFRWQNERIGDMFWWR